MLHEIYLKRRLISVGQLDEEGYHIGFRDQHWKVTKGSLVVAHGNKRGSLYMVEVHPKGIGVIINGSGSAAVGWSKFIQKAMALHLLHQSEDPATMVLLSKTAAGVAIVMLKMVPETPLQFSVAERLSRTFRAESTGIRVEAPKMLWADSISTAYLIYRIPYVLIGLRIPEEEWRGKDTSLAHLKAAAQMKCDTAFEDTKSQQVIRSRDITFVDSIYEARSVTDSSSLTKPIQKSQVVLVDIPENLAENDSIVAEHGLSSEITQSPDEEYSKDEAFFEEGGSETPQNISRKEGITKIVDVQGYRRAGWQQKMKDRCSEKQVLGYVLTVGVTTVEWESRLQKSITMVLIFVEDSWNEEPYSDVHQVRDEREVEVLRSFNWPSSELITEDDVLPERGYS
ncbi:hypothetical protein Tco_1240031 [Tanacetum coccineum]